MESTRLGVRVLELPELKGISLDNYECKLEKRSINKCSKSNKMESTKLNTVLKINEKSKDLFTSNLKTHEEVFVRKLMHIRMHWHNLHPPDVEMSRRQSMIHRSKAKTRCENRQKHPRRLSPLNHHHKPALVTQSLDLPSRDHRLHNFQLRRGSDETNTSDDVDDRVRDFFGTKWYQSKDGAKITKFNRKIPLTFRQQMFLAKIEGLLDPKTPSHPEPDEEIPVKHSRLWVELPEPMNGGEIGDQVRKNSYKFTEDAPLLDIQPDKLSTSKKPDILATWVGLEQEDLDKIQQEKLEQQLFPNIKETEK